jgi:hypothetical protein
MAQADSGVPTGLLGMGTMGTTNSTLAASARSDAPLPEPQPGWCSPSWGSDCEPAQLRAQDIEPGLVVLSGASLRLGEGPQGSHSPPTFPFWSRWSAGTSRRSRVAWGNRGVSFRPRTLDRQPRRVRGWRGGCGIWGHRGRIPGQWLRLMSFQSSRIERWLSQRFP